MGPLVISKNRKRGEQPLYYRDLAEVTRIAKVLFRPSFDRETLLRVMADS